MDTKTLLCSAAKLSDTELRCRVVLLASQERKATVELIGPLAELAARKLSRADGYASLLRIARGRSGSLSMPPTTVSKPLRSLAASPSSSICLPRVL